MECLFDPMEHLLYPYLATTPKLLYHIHTYLPRLILSLVEDPKLCKAGLRLSRLCNHHLFCASVDHTGQMIMHMQAYLLRSQWTAGIDVSARLSGRSSESQYGILDGLVDAVSEREWRLSDGLQRTRRTIGAGSKKGLGAPSNCRCSL